MLGAVVMGTYSTLHSQFGNKDCLTSICFLGSPQFWMLWSVTRSSCDWFWNVAFGMSFSCLRHCYHICDSEYWFVEGHVLAIHPLRFQIKLGMQSFILFTFLCAWLFYCPCSGIKNKCWYSLSMAQFWMILLLIQFLAHVLVIMTKISVSYSLSKAQFC
jgi:hypothetical protein